MSAWIWLALCVTAINPVSLPAQSCKQTSINDSIRSRDGFSRKFAGDLEVRLKPLKDDYGWVIAIGPEGSDEDWTYPMTFPIRTGEQQVMGTGYGSTVQQKMTYPIVVQFVLTHGDFVEYSKLADAALSSPHPEAAEKYMSKVARLRKGQMTVIAVDYEKGETAETIKAMNFKVTLVVPKSFPSHEAVWTPAPCPRFGR